MVRIKLVFDFGAVCEHWAMPEN